MVYVTGELKIDNPIDLHIGRDSRQFTTIRKSGDTITLDDAPLDNRAAQAWRPVCYWRFVHSVNILTELINYA